MNDNLAGLMLVLLISSLMILGGILSAALITKECNKDHYFTFFGSVYTCEKVGEKSVLLNEGINNLLKKKNNED